MMRTDGTGRLRFAGALVLAGTFVVGALGGLAYAQMTRRAVAEQPARIECDDHDRHRGSFLDQLQLTPEQEVRIDAILHSRKEQIDAFWAENGPRMEQIVDSTRAEIRNALTEQQRAEIDRMRAERRAQREREKAACDEQEQEKQ